MKYGIDRCPVYGWAVSGNTLKAGGEIMQELRCVYDMFHYIMYEMFKNKEK